MVLKSIDHILSSFQRGELERADAVSAIAELAYYEDVGFAKIDHHRTLRQGMGEVIFCEGKQVQDISAIAKRILRVNDRLLATRASREAYLAIRRIARRAKYNERARTVVVEGRRAKHKRNSGLVFILTAGTSDISVAEETKETLEFLGDRAETAYDVGVAGIHRVLSFRREINQARVIVVVAGMEGALPSVVGGITDKPILAVPTSSGYGTGIKGIAALLTMLNTCTPGIGVLNIDNGFGAGVLAHRIVQAKKELA